MEIFEILDITNALVCKAVKAEVALFCYIGNYNK